MGPNWQFNLGRRAGLLDQPPYSNPFPCDPQRSDWAEGWRQGQAERKKVG